MRLLRPWGRWVSLWAKVRGGPRTLSNLTWSQLRSISNSSAARMTVLIPIIGYLIIFNQKIITYLHIVREVGGQEVAEAHPSSKLLIIYVGLTFVAIGAALYQIFCPPDVKHYGDTNAYVGGVKSTIREYEMRKIEERLRKSIFASRLLDVRDMFKFTKPDMMLDADDRAAIDNGILHLNFEYLDKEHAGIRAVAAWAFALGFACLAVPSMGVIGRVLWMVAKTLFSDPASFL